jgi:integrase
MDIKAYIKSKREGLAESSITTYASILKSLYKKVWGDEKMDFNKFSEHKVILESLKDLPPNKRKTILSALFIITQIPQYRTLMMEDSTAYAKEIAQNKKTETQEENWVEPQEIDAVLAKLEKDATAIYKKQTKTPQDLQEIQNYIIMVLLSGKYIPTRRSKDFCDFKIKSINPETDNYIDKKNLVFNSYKTAKTYGRQTLPIPIKLKNILNKWIAINPTDYLLFDVNMNPLTNVKLNQRINKIFDGKKVSTNNLRHTNITEALGEHKATKKKAEKLMTDMGSSFNMVDTYYKE